MKVCAHGVEMLLRTSLSPKSLTRSFSGQVNIFSFCPTLKRCHIGSVLAGELQLVVVDWNWRDQKLRSFSEVPEVWQAFVQLYLSHLHEPIRTRQSRIALY